MSCGTRLILRLLIVTERGVNRHGTLVSVTSCDSTIRGNFGSTELLYCITWHYMDSDIRVLTFRDAVSQSTYMHVGDV